MIRAARRRAGRGRRRRRARGPARAAGAVVSAQAEARHRAWARAQRRWRAGPRALVVGQTQTPPPAVAVEVEVVVTAAEPLGVKVGGGAGWVGVPSALAPQAEMVGGVADGRRRAEVHPGGREKEGGGRLSRRSGWTTAARGRGGRACPRDHAGSVGTRRTGRALSPTPRPHTSRPKRTMYKILKRKERN